MHGPIMTTTQQVTQITLVKQVLSGDTVIVWGQPRNGPPAEKTISLSNILAPKLGRRPSPKGEETKDEPYAWEAREFLRKKLVGQEVMVKYDKGNERNNRVYGVIYLGKDPNTSENLMNTLVAEGYAIVRNTKAPEAKHLVELEDAAKSAQKGKHAPNAHEHVRNPKKIDNPRQFFEKFERKPIKAVIEHVRDGSTVRATLLPDFYNISLMISGIRCPAVKIDADGNINPAEDQPYALEARYFVESRLLQRDVEIILESVANNNFVGSIVHPKGNIAEILLKEGLAKCVDWSMASVYGGPEKLRAAERYAKEHKIRLWKDWNPSTPNSMMAMKEKEFTGMVTEIVNADALMVELPDGTSKKIFLASVRPPPRLPEDKQTEDRIKKNFRPLYDIPWMFEAREFLRKNLIGKKVHVKVDYIMPPANNLGEKICCTVETQTGINVAEAMVSKGFATVVRYRADDDQRSSRYDDLLAAELKAQKSMKGIHAKKSVPAHRIQEVVGDVAKAKQFLPYLTRALKTEALVEFVASGSRLRLFVPRETCVITFLLAGISCPRGSRPNPSGGAATEPELYADEALTFTKKRVLQREVKIDVETMDKAGNFIGWLWIDGANLSVMLVEAGLAKVWQTSDHSTYTRALTEAEEKAKKLKLKLWKDYTEEKSEEDKAAEEDKIKERKENFVDVLVVEVTPELHFYAQRVDQGETLTDLTEKMRAEINENPPLPGSYTPKKGELCAAKFVDDLWYRARIEKITDRDAVVMYVDYGNRADEYRDEAVAELKYLTGNGEVTLRLNEEYRVSNLAHVTLRTLDGEDIGRTLVAEGRVFFNKRKEIRFKELMEDYKAAETEARRSHKNMWEYGDVTEDDAKEFGLSR
ncbi:hypothetical protein J437_LFUL004314 [Ladona fulva]|uniref:Staphylococcal nuclease domain-containing protein 1 n=1 Tax=Ladona fulva TaxID=123851 RepID=A0A8K0NWK5_LADFU|nr:hypothetical protein J437_LFUL004314 [Ladona fulva]